MVLIPNKQTTAAGQNRFKMRLVPNVGVFETLLQISIVAVDNSC